MNAKTKYLSALTALSLVFLSACGSSPEISGTPDIPSETETTKAASSDFPLSKAVVSVKAPVEYYTDVMWYDSSGNLFSVSKFTDFEVDENGNVTAFSDYYGGEFDHRVEYDYNGNIPAKYQLSDESGKVFKSNSTNEFGMPDSFAVTCDSAGRPVSATDNGSDNFTDYYTYTVGADGNITKTEMSRPSIDHSSTFIYEYDGSGYLVKETEPETGTERQFFHDTVGYYELSAEKGTFISSDEWRSFEEVKGLPQPDSCFPDIEFVDKKTQNSTLLYTYKLPENPVHGIFMWQGPESYVNLENKKANEVYHAYQSLLSDELGFETSADGNNILYVKQNGTLVSAMQSGYDKDIGYFLMVSFPA